MKTIFILGLAALLAFTSCQKQQTEEERRAEIDKQVEQRLAVEKQKEETARREADLTAREEALAAKESATPTPAARLSSTTTREEPSVTRRTTVENHPLRSGRANGSYDMFYNRLESHGDWLETEDYGYVWQPREAQSSRSWRPYTDGRWVYTDLGWTWVSEESFGWATYHYGRWARLRTVGWVWVPGDEWAPAWVSWRSSNDYVGWAPLPPEARFDRTTGIHKWADSYYDIGPENYSFVQTNQIGDQRLQHVVIPQERNLTIVNQTTNVTNITYNDTTIVNQGPSYDQLRARSQQPIERLRVEREVDIQSNDPHYVVRGEVIAMPAPTIMRAEAIAPPPRVKQRVTGVVIERGWDAISDKQAAQEARRKVRAEATPPPQAAQPTFVKPSAAPESSATATATPRSTRAETIPSVAPTSSVAESTPSVAATSTPSTPRPSISPRRTSTPSATPSASATPSPVRRATATPTPTPTEEEATPTATPRPTATVSESATVTPTSTPRPTFSPRETKRPTASPSATPTPENQSTTINGSPLNSRDAGPSRRDTKAERKAEKQQRRADREVTPSSASTPGPELNASGYATPTPSATARSTAAVESLSPSATSSARGRRNAPPLSSPSPAATAEDANDDNGREKKKRKRDKQRGVEESSESPTATPTPSPTPEE